MARTGNGDGSWKKAAEEFREEERKRMDAGNRYAAERERIRMRAAQDHKEGMAIIEDVLRQFRTAMRRTGNPGRSSALRALWADIQHRYRSSDPKGLGEPISGSWSHTVQNGYSYRHITVYSNGRWRYSCGTEDIVGAGPGGDRYGRSSILTSEDGPSEYRTLTYYQRTADDIREILVQILLKHNVPLPND